MYVIYILSLSTHYICKLDKLTIDRASTQLYSLHIQLIRTFNMAGTMEQDIKNLELQIDQLIEMCKRLQAENKALRNKQASLSSERSELVHKNELVKHRLESMIMRLKTMEDRA